MSHHLHKVNTAITNSFVAAEPAAGSKASHIKGGGAAEEAFRKYILPIYPASEGYTVERLGGEGDTLSYDAIDFMISKNGKKEIYMEFKQRFKQGTKTLETIKMMKSYGGTFCPETKIDAFEKSKEPMKIYVLQLADGYYYARYGGGWKKYRENPIDPRTGKYSSSYDIPIWRFKKMDGKFTDTPLWNNTGMIFYLTQPEGSDKIFYRRNVPGYRWNYNDSGKAEYIPMLSIENNKFKPYEEVVDKSERVNGRRYVKYPGDSDKYSLEKYSWTDEDKSNVREVLPFFTAL